MTAHVAAGESRTGLGIAAMIAGIFCMASMDAMAKWLGEGYPVAQVVFFRGLFGLLPVLLLAQWSGGLRLLLPGRPWVHVMRGGLAAAAIFSFFTALQYMPLAEAWAIGFCAPLVVTALSRPLLGEPVGWRRWLAVGVGFLGVLIVVRPGLAAFQPASLLVLVTAVCYGLIMITARKYAATESTPALVFYTTLTPMLLGAAMLPVEWTTPAGLDWVRFVVLGLLGGSAMLLLTQAFRLAPAAVVVPFDYTALIWSTGWGWLIWNDWPDTYDWLGAAVVVGAGLYVMHREARLRRRAAQADALRASEETSTSSG
ncbi:DMT family transporter [Ferruginivarius sediminum]|uniref:DMT family transporter n=1 Tax=Ferruginivarius sediminum TaxID=2661937 RepID=A0A369TF04_9PROT|nr:DMT family transporter [Ferruginivarius sediminum]RDD63412.1 DMT family transporter [Ferruginivarius sediminum]